MTKTWSLDNKLMFNINKIDTLRISTFDNVIYPEKVRSIGIADRQRTEFL